jgi:hypothetical protein
MYICILKMPNYENYYGITLLDDLHNYFPDVLYGRQFENDRLVSYIRSQARNRFDLFTNAMNNHNHTNRTNNVIQMTGRPTSHNPMDTIRVTYSIDEEHMEVPTSSQEENILNPLLTLLTAALNPQSSSMMFPTLSRQQGLNTFMEPIVVRPTQQQINNGSTIVELTNNSDNCAICQDTLNQDGRQIRRLNTCHHMFHDTCINTWFNTNVRCPTCRHDIRLG